MSKPITCYADGASIRTARGETAVENIATGDQVVVIRDGRECLEVVRWVGHTAINLSGHAYLEDAAPIRFRANAIADNQPIRDLLVSPEHCMIIEGRCVSAKLLVNGGSIVSERDHAPFSYHHIELDRHGVLLAENTPSESYLDTGNRSAFDNMSDARQLHPVFRLNANSSRWAVDACAQLASAAEVESIWTALAARSEQIGFPIPAVATVQDSDLHLVVDGTVIRPATSRNARYVFMVPAGSTSVSLASRVCIPADKLEASQRDTRRLGVRVSWMAIRSEDAETILSADNPGLRTGWNDVEGDGQSMWRWTDGSAMIPWTDVSGAAVLTVCCTQVDAYPIYDDKLSLVA